MLVLAEEAPTEAGKTRKNSPLFSSFQQLFSGEFSYRPRNFE